MQLGPPPHLSPSAASMYEQCPKRWRFRYIDRLPDPPGEPALMGTFAHRVLEMLLQEPPERRTVERARELARTVWPEIANDPDYQRLGLDEVAARRFRWSGWSAIEGLWEVEDPCTVDVHATEQEVRIEVDGIPFRGIIDRVDVVEGGLAVTDYKSGLAPSARFTPERLHQVLLYAAALAELTGERPVKARLLYLRQKAVEVDVDEERLASAVSALSDTWHALVRDCRRDAFEPKTGPLCGWCPYVVHCPEGRAEVERRDMAGIIRRDAPALQVVLADAG